jgi:hypothetical protein
MTRIWIIMMTPLLLAGCGSSTNAPSTAASTPTIADKPDVIITVDGAHRTCVAALYSEPQGSTVPCGDLIPFIRDELRIASGSIYDIHSAAGDNTEMAKVRTSLAEAGYRFIGGHP